MNIRSMMKKFKEPAAMTLFTFLYPVLFFLELTALASSIGMYCLKIRMVEPVNWLIAQLDVKLALKYLVEDLSKSSVISLGDGILGAQPQLFLLSQSVFKAGSCKASD